MTDHALVSQLANDLSFSPDEDKLEAFLQAYKELPQPANLVQGAQYEVALQFAIDEYMETPCECPHDHEEEATA